VLHLEAPPGAPPLLSVYGGKITTYRRLAEATLTRLLPHLPQMRRGDPGWTGRESLPGGNFAPDGFEAELTRALRRWAFVPEPMMRRLLRAYGTCVADLLGAARSLEDLGTAFGADLTEAEIRYLVRREWAMTAEDIVWRRSKLGLRLSQAEIARIDDFLARLRSQQEYAA
jgi:glycerol-3-phosphate dehydrogenase